MLGHEDPFRLVQKNQAQHVVDILGGVFSMWQQQAHKLKSMKKKVIGNKQILFAHFPSLF